MVARDGRVLWVRDVATVIEGDDGRAAHAGADAGRDRPQAAEDAVLESEEKYRTLVETSQDLIWAIDLEHRFTYVNDAVKAIYGYEPEEMIGRPFTDFQSPERRSGTSRPPRRSRRARSTHATSRRCCARTAQRSC